jgi:RimJ/RimL family protein N-acetyltransferase
MTYPTIKKAKRILGKTIIFRNVQLSDAPFILSLRTDEKKSRHLSSVSNQLSAQETWLSNYEHRENEAYFIIENKIGGELLGTVRLYDSNQYSFCWGSWIIKDGAPPATAIESALIVYSYALDSLGFLTAHFQVNKENERVCAFHERFGAQRIAENETEYKYTISNEEIRASMQRYKRYLPMSLIIENK